MAVDSNQFWKLLSDSGLVSGDDLRNIRTAYEAEQPDIQQQPAFLGLTESETVAKWLVQQKVLSDFQADILAKGASGPFKYGNYTVVGRTVSGPLKESFLAVHRSSGHPVLLQFLPGNEPEDLLAWQTLERLAAVVSELHSPHLAAVYEIVVLPHYRFVVSQRPVGKPLSTRVPRKARLPWRDACTILQQVGKAIQEMHQREISHNAISMRTIWFSSSAPAQIRIQTMPDLEFDSNDNPTEESRLDYLAPEQSDQTGSMPGDIFSLGCVLYRLISGRVRSRNSKSKTEKQADQSIADDLSKHKLPPNLIQLLDSMLALDPEKRPSIKNVLTTLDQFIPDNKKNLAETKQAPSEINYRKELTQFKPGTNTTHIQKLPQIQPSTQTTSNPQTNQTAKNQSRKKNNRLLPVVTSAALAFAALILIVFLTYANQHVVGDLEPKTPETNQKDPEQNGAPNTPDPKENADANTKANTKWIQQLVEDDGETLWETPTLGEPIDFSYIPPGPKLIFTARMANLLAKDQGRFLVDAIGPHLQSKLELWQKKTGIPLEDIDRLTISLHPIKFEYHPVFIVETKKPWDRQRLLELWNKPEMTELETGAKIYIGSNSTAYYFTEGDSNRETTQKFLMGPDDLIRESADLAGATPLEGAMKNLAQATDQERDFSMLFLRNALFNDEGQKLMQGSMSGFNQELDVTLNDSIRGGLLSLHLDNGSFIDLRFDQTLDLKPSEFRNWLNDTTKKSLDKTIQFAASAPANPYWDPVRSKYVGMVTDLYRRLRIGIEDKQVIVNCWLPPMAAHNIVGGTELLLTFANGAGKAATPAATRTLPKSIEELLKLPRNLNVTTNPDLNILLADLQGEITDEFGKLPFPFEIKLLGNDLLVEGITKNQRPGEFNIQQKTLSEILTEIMIRANPTKDITGAADPNCKLVWVVGPDPDNPERQIILVTTRGAAATKSYTLPPPFQPE